MASLHSRKTVIFGYTVGFMAILGCLLMKQKEQATAHADTMATELDAATTDEKSFESVIEKRFKRPTKNRALFPVDVSAAPVDGVYHIYTAQGLDDFVATHADKPVVVKFANKKACSACKGALAANYLLSAKFLPGEAYFAEIDETEFDDLEYFAELAPIIPAFKIYIDGDMIPAIEFQGLRSRTQIQEELTKVPEERRKRALRQTQIG